MKKQMRRVVPLVMAGTLLMSGCGRQSARDLPYDLVKSTYEVYQESIAASEYVNTRESGVQQYEYHTVTNATDKQRLIGMVDKIEDAFNGAPNSMTNMLIDRATYENMKYMLDRYTLVRSGEPVVMNASDLYVVDVTYTASRAPQLEIPACADMVGIDGLFVQKIADSSKWYADDKFGLIVAFCMNDYCVKNAVMYNFAYDMGDHRVIMNAGAPTAITVVYDADTTAGAAAMQGIQDAGFDPTQFVSGDDGKDEDEFDFEKCDLNSNDLKDIDELRDFCAAWNIEAGPEKGAYAAYYLPDTDEDNEVTEEEMREAMKRVADEGYPEGYTMVYAVPRDYSREEAASSIDVSYEDYLTWAGSLTAEGIKTDIGLNIPVTSELIPESQRIEFPVLEVNTIVGSLTNGYASANTDIFEEAANYTLGGRGFFGNSGSTGLNVFDPNFVGTGATISVRYYIKDSAEGLSLVAALPLSVECSTNLKSWKDAKPMMLTDNITGQVQDVLYGLDRVICNEDLTGVSGGTLVLNKAYAGLMCYGRVGTVISDYNTTLDAIVGYDEGNQLYICRCNRQYNIGGMNTGCTGKYKELVYIAVQMTTDGARIVDELPVSTVMVSEPYIEPTPLADMVAASLPQYSQTVPKEMQDAINSVLQDYYTGCNARKLHIESDADVEQYGTHIGIEDVYSVSERLFDQHRADLAIARMKNYLTVNGGSTVSISPVEYQGCTPVLCDLVVTETFTPNSAAEPIVEKIRYTFVQDNGRWRICDYEVLETNQTTFVENINDYATEPTGGASANAAPQDSTTESGAPEGEGSQVDAPAGN